MEASNPMLLSSHRPFSTPAPPTPLPPTQAGPQRSPCLAKCASLPFYATSLSLAIHSDTVLPAVPKAT